MGPGNHAVHLPSGGGKSPCRTIMTDTPSLFRSLFMARTENTIRAHPLIKWLGYVLKQSYKTYLTNIFFPLGLSLVTPKQPGTMLSLGSKEAAMNIWSNQSAEAKKKRWDPLWALEDMPRPLWFIPATPVMALASKYLGQGRSVTTLFSDREVQFKESLNFVRFFSLVQKFWSRDDFVPHLQPQMGVGVFASAFGCQADFPDDQFPRVHPLMKTGEAADRVNQIEPPGIKDGQLGQVLEFADYFNKKAGKKYPIAMTDLQGPMDTAYLVWNATDFMMAMY